MKFKILFSDIQLGVLPASELIQGSTDLGDVLNSFVTFVYKSFQEHPTHAASVLHKTIPNVITDIITLADSFEVDTASAVSESDFDGQVIFKGQEYYVLDYSTSDHQRTDVQLDLRLKSVVDAESVAFSLENAGEDTLDAIMDVVKMYLSGALQRETERRNNPQVQKDVTHSPYPIPGTSPVPPVAIASPALPWQRIADGYALPAMPTPPVIGYPQSTKGIPDVEAAKLALANLLKKGCL